MGLIRKIRESTKMRVGVALKPATPVDTVLGLLEHIDMVLVMTVEPGFGGQAMLTECLEKAKID